MLFLEKVGFEVVAGVEVVGFMAGYEFLYGFKYYIELGEIRRWFVRGEIWS